MDGPAVPKKGEPGSPGGPPPLPIDATDAANSDLLSGGEAEVLPPAGEAEPEIHGSAPGALPGRKRRRLGDLLIEMGLITDAQLERALSVQQMGGGRLGSILVRLSFLKPSDFRKVLQQQLGVELVDLGAITPDPHAIDIVPSEFVKRYEIVPLRSSKSELLVGMIDPYNITAIDDLRFATGVHSIKVAAITQQDYTNFVEAHLKTQSLIEEILDGGQFYEDALRQLTDEEDDDDNDDDELVNLELRSDAPPIITMANFILLEACRRGASDIHIEPLEHETRIRYRIDGILHTLLQPPRSLHKGLTSRIKVMADIDIANRRTPQDGRIAVAYQDGKVQMRVNTLPTTRGEKCVIRLAFNNSKEITVDDLPLDETQRKVLLRAARNPQGMILVTGPTASGKSTTVRAILGWLNDPEVNLVTLEDPVEVEMPGLCHVPIQNKGGVTFSAGLRAILRQDPDIVFIGEIRDAEVASIGTRAALTGHLVLSTLHTNSAAATLGRLVDLGVEPFLVGSTVLCIVAQRLVRKICPACEQPATPTEEQIEEFNLTEEELATAKLVEGAGCNNCEGTGYRGRLAIFEVLPVKADLAVLIREQANELELLQHARNHYGYSTLAEDGRRKALAGKTTLAEVQRVTITVE